MTKLQVLLDRLLLYLVLKIQVALQVQLVLSQVADRRFTLFYLPP